MNLPTEMQELFTKITKYNGTVSEKIEPVLLKLWQAQELTEEELNLDIAPADVAAIWSVTHKRPLAVSTVQQTLLRRKGKRKEPIQPSQQWGSGPTLRRLYRLGDILSVRVQERTKKEDATDQKED